MSLLGKGGRNTGLVRRDEAPSLHTGRDKCCLTGGWLDGWMEGCLIDITHRYRRSIGEEQLVCA